MGGFIRRRRDVAWGLVLCAATSCTNSEGPAPAQPTGPTTPAAAPAEPAPQWETSTFFLASKTVDAPYGVNKTGRFAIELEGRGPWKVNQEFPLRIRVTAPQGAGVHPLELAREDASVFTEQAAKFEIPVKPELAGNHHVTCDVSFSMCTPEQCILENRTLALDLAVN